MKEEILQEFEDGSGLYYKVSKYGYAMCVEQITLYYKFRDNIISTICMTLKAFQEIVTNFLNKDHIVNMAPLFSIDIINVTNIDEETVEYVKIQAEIYNECNADIFALYYIHNGKKYYIFEKENYVNKINYYPIMGGK
jgi:hypothetical protein